MFLYVLMTTPRYTWVTFIREKYGPFFVFETLCRRLQRESGQGIGKIIHIRRDNGREFENSHFSSFYTVKGIVHEFSSPITPQHNRIVKRKNHSLQKMSRVMIHPNIFHITFGQKQ